MNSEVGVAVGTWLYADTVETAVKIVQTDVIAGSGDFADPPEFREDRPGPCFRAWWESPGEPGAFRAASGQHETLAEAVKAADLLVPGIVWSKL